MSEHTCSVADPNPVNGVTLDVATFCKICMSKQKNCYPLGVCAGCAPSGSVSAVVYSHINCQGGASTRRVRQCTVSWKTKFKGVLFPYYGYPGKRVVSLNSSDSRITCGMSVKSNCFFFYVQAAVMI